MTLEDKVHAFRLHVLQRAQELGDVSAACREAGISRTLHRLGLRTRTERLLVLEVHSAKSAGLLTDRTRRNLARRKVRHVQAEKPGELVCIDTFYIGNLKGVGKMWQLTACDAASSYGMAKVVSANNATEAATFLHDVVSAEMEKAGWKLWRVLTDGGSEFKGAFDEMCRELNVRHTRTKPRHAWTNGFVERLQGTILHEHRRIAFRKRYFRGRFQLQTSRDSLLRFYNFDRPHQGYRTKGRTPAEIFWGAVREHCHEEG